MEAPESSTREATPSRRIFRAETVSSDSTSQVQGSDQAACPVRTRLTDLVNQVSERRILTDGNDQTLDRSHNRWERQDTSSLVLLSGPVRVLKERVEDSTETERWLDDVGDKFSD